MVHMSETRGFVFLLIHHHTCEDKANNYNKSSDRSANDGDKRRAVITT